MVEKNIPKTIYRSFIRPIEEVEFLADKTDEILENETIFEEKEGIFRSRTTEERENFDILEAGKNLDQMIGYYDSFFNGLGDNFSYFSNTIKHSNFNKHMLCNKLDQFG